MALTKYKLGQLIELSEARNSEGKYGIDAVKGISIKKMFIETKADMEGVGLKPYLVVSPNDFAYVTVTSRNGEKITLAHNTTEETFIVSSSYVVFRVCRTDLLNSDWLFMYFNRPEFDRYARFNSWGSARETFSWDDMRDIDIDLPPLSVQEKYVEVYNSMVANQKAYEKSLNDLKLACDAFIEQQKTISKCVSIMSLLKEVDVRNQGCKIKTISGINIEKKFMPSKADVADAALVNYKVVNRNQIAYSSMQTGRDECIRIALQREDESKIVSPAYYVFDVKSELVIPEWIILWFQRSEIDRKGWFLSDSSVRANLDLDRFAEIWIPLPKKAIQQQIVDVFDGYLKSQELADRLRNQLMGMCPILIKGALEEGKRK